MNKSKIKICKICKLDFTIIKFAQIVCSPKCAIQLAKNKQKEKEQKEWKAEKAILKDKLKTLSDYSKELQKEVNTIVRLIDKDTQCISTLKPLNNKFDAGHFYSVGSNPSLRFHLDNIHAQSVYANQYLSGDQMNYLNGLSDVYGIDYKDYVISLKSIYKVLKLSIDEMKEKITISRGIIKWLKLQDRKFTIKERIYFRNKFNNEIGIYN
jgi:predicted RNase H-like nuclease (RuvC/YqgF family)